MKGFKNFWPHTKEVMEIAEEILEEATEFQSKHEGKVALSKLNFKEMLDVAVQIQRNRILADAFVVRNVDEHPVALEKVAMCLQDLASAVYSTRD